MMQKSRTEYFKKYRKTEQYKESQKRYRQVNREKINAQKRARYHADPEKYRKRQRDYLMAHPEKNRDPEKNREYANKFYHEHPEKCKAYQEKYRQGNLKKFSERQKKYLEANPKYVRANSLSQLIPLKNFCEDCGSSENLQKHHPDYSFPRKIETLCFKCHLEKHGKQSIQEMIIHG